MSTGLVEIIKRASLDAVENSKPCDLRFGTVISTSPLKVQVTNQFTIPESILIVPMHLTDYETELSFDDSSVRQKYEDWTVDESELINTGKIAFTAKIKHKITVYNALKVGDKVALLRKVGGQFYYILDRLPK